MMREHTQVSEQAIHQVSVVTNNTFTIPIHNTLTKKDRQSNRQTKSTVSKLTVIKFHYILGIELLQIRMTTRSG